MKHLRLVFLVPVLPLLFLATGVSFSSCEKRIIHDTTTVYDVTSGLVAYYNFNGGSLKDSSIYSNNITFNSATPTKDRHGIDSNAYLFNGTSSYMQVPNSPSLNPDNITLFAIVKVNGFYNGACKGNDILVKGSPDNINGWYVMRYYDTLGCGAANFDSTREIFGCGYGDNIPQGSAAGAGGVHVSTGTWYTLTYTYDGLTSKFYVNGELKSTMSKSVPFNDNTHDLFIGKNESAIYPYWLNGVIDEVRIYNRALVPEAIKQLYNQTK